MRNTMRMAALVVVCGVVLGVTLPELVHAGAPAPRDVEREKILDLIKLQAVFARGEHALMHEILDQLLAKYPDDPDIKRLDEFHESWHSRARLQEEMAERTRMILGAGVGD